MSATKKKIDILDVCVYATYFGLGAAIVWFATLNVAPYRQILNSSVAEIAKDGFVKFLTWIPVLGIVFQRLGKGTVWFVAFFLWVVIQVIEVLPGVLWRNHAFLSSIVRAADSGGVVGIKDKDAIALKSAKRALNNLIGNFLNNMWLYCICTYLLDLMICSWYYPLMPGISWDATIGYFFIGKWKYLSISNLFGVISTLFAVEILIHLLISVNVLQGFLRGSTERER